MALTPEQLIAYIEGLAAGGMTPQEYNDVITYILANGETENAPRDLIQIRRGNKANLPVLALGEMALTLDTFEFYTGGVNGNIPFNDQSFINVKVFGAVGDDVADDTSSFQAGIDFLHVLGGGVLFIPKGNYKISNPIVMKPNVRLQGVGCGAYFAGGGYDRLSVIKPSSAFVGNEIVRIDPSDTSAGLSYIYGCSIKDLLIDMINIKNFNKKVITIKSLSNSENFENIKVVNNNNSVALHIGKSSNVSALKSDGLVFSNIYCLPETNNVISTNPVLHIESGNEMSFRDCKFQNSSMPSVVSNSKSVYISAETNQSVAAITFDSCSFTGAETGVYIESKSSDGEGARWIRVQNSTFETLVYGIRMKGDSARPTQFCVLGSGNRFIEVSTKDILLEPYSSNNQVIADESTSVELQANSSGNQILGTDAVVNNGSNNLVLFRVNDSLSAKEYIQGWETLALGSGWVNNTISRSVFGYRKLYNSNKVALKGYLTGGTWGFPNTIFTLPVGYRPSRGLEIPVASGNGGAKIIIDSNGEVFGFGGTGELSLDGIEFFLD